MQQRRHVSALFYGAIFMSSTVTKEEIQQSPWGVLYIVGRLWTLKTRSRYWQEGGGRCIHKWLELIANVKS